MTTLAPPTWTLADRIRKARESARLTQDELGNELGVSRRSVQLWEAGGREPKRATLIFLALRCGVPIWWLLDDDPDNSYGWSDDAYRQAGASVRSRCFSFGLAVAA